MVKAYGIQAGTHDRSYISIMQVLQEALASFDVENDLDNNAKAMERYWQRTHNRKLSTTLEDTPTENHRVPETLPWPKNQTHDKGHLCRVPQRTTHGKELLCRVFALCLFFDTLLKINPNHMLKQ